MTIVRHSFVGSQEKLDKHLAALTALCSDIIVVMPLVTIVFVCIK